MSVTVNPEQLSALRATLLNTAGATPLHERFRALFMLKAVGGDEVIEIVSEGRWFCSPRHTRPICWLPLPPPFHCPLGPGHSDLRHFCPGTTIKCFANADSLTPGLEDPSPLLKHELAYVLGQLKNDKAIPTLEGVLVNAQGKHCSMVRHEAAEALGALSSESSLPLLRKYLDDPAREVRETCEIAVGKIEFDISPEGKARLPK